MRRGGLHLIKMSSSFPRWRYILKTHSLLTTIFNDISFSDTFKFDGKESWHLSTERENPKQDRTGISGANLDQTTPNWWPQR